MTFQHFLHVFLNSRHTIQYTIYNIVYNTQYNTYAGTSANIAKLTQRLGLTLNHVNQRSMWILQCVVKVWCQFFLQCMLVLYWIHALPVIQEIYFRWQSQGNHSQQQISHWLPKMYTNNIYSTQPLVCLVVMATKPTNWEATVRSIFLPLSKSYLFTLMYESIA